VDWPLTNSFTRCLTLRRRALSLPGDWARRRKRTGTSRAGDSEAGGRAFLVRTSHNANGSGDRCVADDETRRADLVARGALPSSGRSDLQLTAVHFASIRMDVVAKKMAQYFQVQGDPCVNERYGTGRAFTLGATRLLYWPRSNDAPSLLYKSGSLRCTIDVLTFGYATFGCSLMS